MSEEEKMKLEEITEEATYFFNLNIEGNKLVMKIEEDKVYAPFTFEAGFTKDDFIDHHKVFRGCNDLEEIMEHVKKLHQKGKVDLKFLGVTRNREIFLKVADISLEDQVTKEFTLEQKMVENKDEALKKLYDIQKDDFDKMKKIKEYVEKELPAESPLRKQIIANLEKSLAKL